MWPWKDQVVRVGWSKLAAFTIKLIVVGSSQAFALGLLASLSIPKPGRGGKGADWMSKGPRQSFAPNSASSWPIHMSSEISR